MIIGLRRYTMPLGLAAILASCDSGVPTEPLVLPIEAAGEYELVASGETTSKAWDWYTVHIEGSLTLEQDPTERSKLSGTFRELRLVEADGAIRRKLDGIITGSVDASANVILTLRTASGDFEWTGRGKLLDSQIAGQWQRRTDIPAAGGFIARIKPPGEITYPDIGGVYDVDAPILGFDPVWGDYTDWRYTAVITIKRDGEGPGISGTFVNFEIADATGKKDTWSASGTLGGEIDRNGQITLELSATSQSFTWSAKGRLNANAIEGTWGRGGHFYGSFRAVRR